MPTRSWTERTAVYIVTVGEGFKPTSDFHLPETFTEGHVYVKNVTMEDGRAAARAFNKRAMEDTQSPDVAGWDRQWAIAAACVRRKGAIEAVTSPRRKGRRMTVTTSECCRVRIVNHLDGYTTVVRLHGIGI